MKRFHYVFRFLLLSAGLLAIDSAPSLAQEVMVPAPSQYSYEPSSVVQASVRGSYGRYIAFRGRSTNAYSGTQGFVTPGNPGNVNCSYTGSYANCYRSGYVPPTYFPGTSGGMQSGWFDYLLDCQDLTFDRKGDRSRGVRRRGWMSVQEDPTAQAVASQYCPSIDSLPLGPGS